MLLLQWDQLGNPGSIGILAVVFVVIGMVGTAYSTFDRIWRLGPEIDKWRKEALSKSGETLNLLQEKRGFYDKAVAQFARECRELRDALEQNRADGLDALREACCESFTSQILNTHVNYVEFERLYYEGDYDALEDFISDDVVDDLNRFTRWVKLLNNPKLLGRIPGSRNRLVITRQTVKPLTKLPQSLPLPKREKAKRHLDGAIRSLLAVGNESN